jgi:hypothetical protein
VEELMPTRKACAAIEYVFECPRCLDRPRLRVAVSAR